MSESLAIALKLALVTGQRVGMISGMAKTELELGRVGPVREGMARSGASGFVFPSPTGDAAIAPHAATRAMSRWRPDLGLADFRVHDLRRTCATGMARLGVPRSHISLVLDHVSVTQGTITGAVYDKYSYDAEKRAALDKWSDHLARCWD